MGIYRGFASAHPKPVICEMGGKNPVVVSASADLDAAVEGTARSACRLAGQKCSAASRAFVDERVADEFAERLAERAGTLVVGDPTRKEPFVGPVIDAPAVERFEARSARHARGEVFAGGDRVTRDGLDRGYFLEPTVVSVPDDSYLWTTELFCPLIAVRPVSGLDEAIERSNATPFGLTAILRPRRGRDRALPRPDRRRRLRQSTAGATGLARRAAVRRLEGERHERQGRRRPYYLQQYLREQSRSIVG